MYLVRNASMAGRKAITAYGVLEFDSSGVVGIPDKELYEALIKLPGFEPVITEDRVKKVVETEVLDDEQLKPRKKKRGKEEEGLKEEEPKEEAPEDLVF